VVVYPALGARFALVEFQGALRVLGERIRNARKLKGLSQERLALEAGIDRSFMGQVERGQRNVSFSTLCRLASVIEQDVGALCEGLPAPDQALVEDPTPYQAKRPKSRTPSNRG